jgi:hypothetical protein
LLQRAQQRFVVSDRGGKAGSAPAAP